MLFKFLERRKIVAETSFSKFIREAPSAEKKRVYSAVIEKAANSQQRLLAEAGSRASTGPVKAELVA